MYSEDDLNAAVAGGALTQQAADSLRAYTARRRHAPLPDEEQFRLLTGFNDIFVTIAILLTLVATWWLILTLVPPAASPGIALLCWLLAEHFTRRRRMALPSILLLLAFAGAAGLTGGDAMLRLAPQSAGATLWSMAFVVGVAAAALAAGLHWFRFKVPITIAVLTTAALSTAIGTALVVWPMTLLPWITELTFVCGLLVFAIALWWDTSDPGRVTRRSDVAFWLHLAAAPMLVHPVFALLGLLGSGADLGRAVAAVLVYAGLGVIALVIDRRALLVSALAYVLFATSSLLRSVGALSLSFALTGLLIGGALLAMSVWWHSLRRPLLRQLPAGLRQRLPAG
jgi:hypothetical protein